MTTTEEFHPIVNCDPHWKTAVPFCTEISYKLRNYIGSSETLRETGLKLGGIGLTAMGFLFAVPTGGASLAAVVPGVISQYKGTVRAEIYQEKAWESLKEMIAHYSITDNEVTILNLYKAFVWVELRLVGPRLFDDSDYTFYSRGVELDYREFSEDPNMQRLVEEIKSPEELYAYINAYSWRRWAEIQSLDKRLSTQDQEVDNRYGSLHSWYYVGKKNRRWLEPINPDGKTKVHVMQLPKDMLLSRDGYLTPEILFNLGLGEEIVTGCSEERLLNVTAVYRGLRQRLLARDCESTLETALLYLAVFELKIEYKRLQQEADNAYKDADLEDIAELAESIQMMQGDISAPIWPEAA